MKLKFPGSEKLPYRTANIRSGSRISPGMRCSQLLNLEPFLSWVYKRIKAARLCSGLDSQYLSNLRCSSSQYWEGSILHGRGDDSESITVVRHTSIYNTKRNPKAYKWNKNKRNSSQDKKNFWCWEGKNIKMYPNPDQIAYPGSGMPKIQSHW